MSIPNVKRSSMELSALNLVFRFQSTDTHIVYIYSFNTSSCWAHNMSSKDSKQCKLHGAVAQIKPIRFQSFPNLLISQIYVCKIFQSKILSGLQQGIHWGEKTNITDCLKRLAKFRFFGKIQLYFSTKPIHQETICTPSPV